MKIISRIALTVGCIAATATFAMDEKGWASTYESMAAFENRVGGNPLIFNRPDYVKPIIDNLGNVLNSNWYVSASVPQSLFFEAGLPVSIIPIGDDDRKFNQNGIVVPTIFGDHAPLYPDMFGNMQPNYNDPVVYGNKTLNGLGVFTYPYIQLAGGLYHARIALRGMILPSISNLQKFNLFGFGLQYSFGHFFQYMLPPAVQGLDVSLVYGYSTSGIGYRPDDYAGSLNLDISAHTFDMVIGYKPLNFIEVMMTLGYQSATMKSSGHLICDNPNDKEHNIATHPNDPNSYSINPNISVDGNNGFKFGLAVAFQLGSSYHPVVGFDYAGKSSFTTNVLYFRQQFGTDKSPDEIAKEKGNSGPKIQTFEDNEQVQESYIQQDSETDSFGEPQDESYSSEMATDEFADAPQDSQSDSDSDYYEEF